MLRKIRITLAVLCFVPVTLLFLDFTGTIHAWFGWLAKIQFLPAVLALNVGVIVAAAGIAHAAVWDVFIVRSICPLGVISGRDFVDQLGRRRKKKYRFSYSPAVVVAALYGAVGIVRRSARGRRHRFASWRCWTPYSSYGRIASESFRSRLWQWGNNLLAYFAERSRQLRFLPDGGVDEEPADFCDRWPPLLSWRWSCWHGGTVVPIATRFAR